MSVNPAVRTLYAAQVLRNLDAAHVWADGCNTNYEGEIKGKGDTLKIFSVGRPTVSSYTVGQAITYERIRPADQELHIDQDKVWAVTEDHLEAMLQKVNTFAELTKNGAWAFVDASDQFLAFAMAAAAANSITSTIVGNGSTDDRASDIIEAHREALKEQDVGGGELHLFVPYWFMTKLRQEAKFSSFGTEANRRTARGDMILELAGMTIHETTNALNSAGTAIDTNGPVNMIIGAWKGATTWGRHIPPEEALQTFDSSENRDNYDKLMRSRYVYGAKVTHPQGLTKQVITKGS